MTKRLGYNLLAFVYFSNQRRGTAKLVLKKSTCKRIIKIYKKNKNLQISDKVRLLSNFLSSNIVSKISALAEESSMPYTLIDEIVFVILEQWELFLQWSKKITNALIITVNKNLEFSADWVGNENIFAELITEYTINYKELGMNTIIFNNGFSYERDGIKYSANGIAKIILTPCLWKQLDKLNNSFEISQYLRNEQIFCYLSLEPNSDKILNYAFEQLAVLIFNNKKYVNDAFLKFKVGVVLEFEAVVHEQFQLKQISAMKVNSEELK